MNVDHYVKNGVSVKNDANSVDVYAPKVNIQTGWFQGKLHLAKPDSGEMFCGCTAQLWCINQADVDWVSQPDVSDEVCQKCKPAAIKFLTRGAEHSATENE